MYQCICFWSFCLLVSCHMNSIGLHPASLILKLTYTSSTHRRGLNPPHRVKSISMTTFTHQEIEFLQKHSNEVSCTLYNQRLSTIFHIVEHYFYSHGYLVLIQKWHLGIFSQPCLVNFIGIPLSLLFFSHFSSSPPPFLYSLTSLPALPPPPPPPQSPPYLPLFSFLCPPCRSVNTSGWASMTTGHQLFQISENHRK